MDRGEDIGHFGRLTFIMVARHFVDNGELVELLTKVRDVEEQEILEWQTEQDFQICPNPDDPDACSVYNELAFPDGGYEGIQEYQEKRHTAGSS